jgi:hypothetical protein
VGDVVITAADMAALLERQAPAARSAATRATNPGSFPTAKALTCSTTVRAWASSLTTI